MRCLSDSGRVANVVDPKYPGPPLPPVFVPCRQRIFSASEDNARQISSAFFAVVIPGIPSISAINTENLIDIFFEFINIYHFSALQGRKGDTVRAHCS